MLTPAIAKILLVEDDEQGVISAQLFFDEETWDFPAGPPPQLLVARSADEFVSLVAQHGDQIEAIVTDIILSNDPTAPGTNGVAVYAQLASDIPCFAITGQAPDGVAIEALRAGVVDYLKKPFSWGVLWDKIQTRVALARADRARLQLQRAVAQMVDFLAELEITRKPALSRQLMRKIVEVAVLATGARGGWLFLGGEEGLVFQLSVGCPELSLTPERGLFREAFQTGREQCLYLTGEEQADFLAPFERQQGALLVVPLNSESATLGSLVLARPRGEEPFSAAQVSLMNQFSDLGGVTLEAHLRDLDTGRLMARGLAWAVSQSPQGRESLSALQAQVQPLDSQPHPLWDDLGRLRALGEPHLEYWSRSLRIYLETFE